MFVSLIDKQFESSMIIKFRVFYDIVYLYSDEFVWDCLQLQKLLKLR